MDHFDIDVSAVRKLLELAADNNLEELTVQEADLTITVKGSAAGRERRIEPAEPRLVRVDRPLQQPPTSDAVPVSADDDEDVVPIKASLVGVFYRSPAPDQPTFVEIGDVIEVGTEIGLIEAMKVFSPIPSEIAGEVTAILAKNGQLVRQGDVLMKVRETPRQQEPV